MNENQKRIEIDCEEEEHFPILDNIDNLGVAKEVREYIKVVYPVIKESEAYTRSAFLTGVSKFSRCSIFIGLKMLTDISLNPRFGDTFGFTH